MYLYDYKLCSFCQINYVLFCSVHDNVGHIMILVLLNCLPNNKFLTRPNSKHLQTKIQLLLKMMIFVFNRVENMLGKGENADYQHFLLFPPCFQKVSVLGSLKVGSVW